ncbi:phenylalanine--tRNA ligase subunit beta [Alicyclobacillus acidocaldarius]|uniref:Phenylalanine--tRNA ligase beta subunit n=1 Tax=Alicyclobacillus acidocaldarius subsp. acidocaldarius (strain ATCC 27009 / DSM 446 / BCRC 14685 / JCM 5260 / KCTC 1825 / NBRC 15652 / NCIMB 11725 / NRRL B-14509 / 104-IA) TaxID=521098 RepID=C8WQJ3_ALIAD|nr:phenylalanine--tRNA ligase subunit beta [Alicyclobacillus acidocaldarius]ACV59138.1 phenylalanyl-tRNA synthetase, beta subunit [Alicyclobacillus acidocaldarius subsp. acidocaldarius DSM 446]
MRASYKWLAEYLDLAGLSPAELADRLTSAGLAVDAVDPLNRGVEGVVIGKILEVRPHPQADRLKVCRVDVGGRQLEIVCGAPNAAPGLVVPVALPGAKLPGGVEIRIAEFRGVSSHGMLCSADELGIETRYLPKRDVEGLFVLPEDLPLGEDVVPHLHLDDVVLDLDLTPNRSDCLSIRGLVHELSAILRRPHRFPASVPAPAAEGESPLQVRLETPRCPRYEAQLLEGVEVRETPLWMKMRLLAMGVRSIDLVVDVTNYVMLEWGQPLHAFDADAIAHATIVVRQAREGERLVTLDGQERALTPDMIVIADPEKAIGLAGVMGGENSEIGPSTRRIALESARFDGASIRRTGQALSLRSEAQQRFEKGVDPAAVSSALHRATELLVQLAGSRPVGAPRRVPAQADVSKPTVISFSPRACARFLGVDVPEEEMRACFESLGFDVTQGENEWRVEVPTRRPDVQLPADLYEEVARLYGYDHIPATSMRLPVEAPESSGQLMLVRKVRRALVDWGLHEVRTYALTSPEAEAPVAPSGVPVPLLRPMSDDRRTLRRHLLPSLAEVARHNLAHQVLGGAIFEVGKVFLAASWPQEALPEERAVLGMLWFGEPEGDPFERPRRYDFYDAKGVCDALLARLGIQATYRVSQHAYLHPGRQASIEVNGEPVGLVGELHPDVGEAYEVERAVYAEFDLGRLLSLASSEVRVLPIPRHPASRRDLAVVVPRELESQALVDAAWRTLGDRGDLRLVRVFDVYTGVGVPEGHKSLAVALWFQRDERTLTDAEIDEAVEAVLRAWEAAFGAKLRA